MREKVSRQLRALGPAVWDEIGKQDLTLTPAQEDALHIILEDSRDDTFKTQWQAWLQSAEDPDGDEAIKLEGAFDLLARWQLGEQAGQHGLNLSLLLDDLALDFVESGLPREPHELSRFLFAQRLTGAAPEEYYHPSSSNLVHVIHSGRGLPISLASIFILVGERLNLEIHGCSFPGHFLARAVQDGRDVIFDCFHGGRLFSPDETAALRKTAPFEMSTPAPAVVIILRVLHNLANAFFHNDEPERGRFVLGLLEELQHALQQ